MDWRYILLGVMVFIVFISLGNNPMENKDNPFLYKDRLDYYTKKHLDETKSGGLSDMLKGNSVPSMGNFGTPNRLLNPLQQNPSQLGLTSPVPQQQAPLNSLSTVPTLQSPLISNPQHEQPDPFKTMPTQNAPGVRAPQSAIPELKLPDGRHFQFSGSRIFMRGQDGSLQQVADGDYTLANGIKIEVRKGRRQIPFQALPES